MRMMSMPMVRLAVLAVVFTVVLVPSGTARAELIEFEDQATNVVTGTVKKVDANWSLDFDILASYLVRHYRATIEVEAAVSGGGIEPGQTIHVRYWQKDWVPLTLAAVLGLALLGLVGIRRHIRAPWLRWLLSSLLVTTALLVGLLSLPLPGMFGHRDFPHEGQRVRAYLKANPSGEYDALYPSWVDRTPKGPFGRDSPSRFE